MNLGTKLAEYIGSYEVYDDFNTNSKILRLQDGTIYRIDGTTIAFMKSDLDLFYYLIDIMDKKQIDSAKTYLLDTDNKPSTKRIREINNELDIIRGIVPTPKGYKVDLKRAKELMVELKRLLDSNKTS